jgi:hypothetical protein
MAANGISLKPIRMGDLVAEKPAAQAVKSGGKYVPPVKRTGAGEPEIKNIDFSDKNFPVLGAVAKKVTAWGKHVVTKPVELVKLPDPKCVVEKKESLSDKIKEKIRLDELNEQQGNEEPETDPWKMSDMQLANAGWTKLSLRSAKDICLNGFKYETDPCIPGFIEEADSGMSFEEYRHYNSLSLPEAKTRIHMNIHQEEYYDFSEDELDD